VKKISAIEMAMNLVGGKYKCLILYHLSSGAKRTHDLLLLLEGISSKVLTEQLRQLEEDGLIERTVYAEVPPRVEYTLSAEGQTFLPVLQLMCDWGWEYDSRHQGIVKPCISRTTE
jgi:product hxlR